MKKRESTKENLENHKSPKAYTGRWFTGTMVIVTEQKMTKYRTIVSSRMGSDFNEKTN